MSPRDAPTFNAREAINQGTATEHLKMDHALARKKKMMHSPLGY